MNVAADEGYSGRASSLDRTCRRLKHDRSVPFDDLVSWTAPLETMAVFLEGLQHTSLASHGTHVWTGPLPQRDRQLPFQARIDEVRPSLLLPSFVSAGA